MGGVPLYTAVVFAGYASNISLLRPHVVPRDRCRAFRRTSLIRPPPPVGPYSGYVPRELW